MNIKKITKTFQRYGDRYHIKHWFLNSSFIEERLLGKPTTNRKVINELSNSTNKE